MNYDQAVQMRDEFTRIGGFTKIEIEHFGFLARRTPESEVDGKWEIHLHTVNAKAGNRSMEIVRDFAPEQVLALARKAKGKATARDLAAFSRMAAEREVNRS